MTRPGWSGHSRFDDLLTGDADVDDQVDEPPDVHWRRQVEQLRLILERTPPSDPGQRQRLERDIAAAEHALAAATIDDHWSSGEGDRKLF